MQKYWPSVSDSDLWGPLNFTVTGCCLRELHCIYRIVHCNSCRKLLAVCSEDIRNAYSRPASGSSSLGARGADEGARSLALVMYGHPCDSQFPAICSFHLSEPEEGSWPRRLGLLLLLARSCPCLKIYMTLVLRQLAFVPRGIGGIMCIIVRGELWGWQVQIGHSKVTVLLATSLSFANAMHNVHRKAFLLSLIQIPAVELE